MYGVLIGNAPQSTARNSSAIAVDALTYQLETTGAALVRDVPQGVHNHEGVSYLVSYLRLIVLFLKPLLAQLPTDS